MNGKLGLFFWTVVILLIIPITNAYCASAPPPDPGCWPPPCVPIDGGISFLVVAGIAYGSKKVYDSKKSK